MRELAVLISLGRFLFGVAYIAAPEAMGRWWIGRQARLPGAQLVTRGVGARDLTVGLGGLQALARKDGSARPWLAAAATCDAVDFGATWAAGGGIPRRARTGVLAFAGVLSVLSAIAAVGNGSSDTQSSPSVELAGERRREE